MSETSQSESPAPYHDEGISSWEILARLIERRGRILVWSFAGFALAVALTLVAPRTWTSEALLRPQSAAVQEGRLSSLAAQFGVSVPGSSSEDSPEFYAELLESRALLLDILSEPFALDGKAATPLADLLEFEDDLTAGQREHALLQWLRETAITVSTAAETGIITVSVTTEWPEVSEQIANRLTTAIDRFNREQRSSHAGEERAFIESQREEAAAALRSAEEALQRFLEENRQFQNSPELTFEHDRLQRKVVQQQQLVTSLEQAYQEARIAEVRTTPVVNVIQAAYLPGVPDRRGLALKALLGLIGGGVFGVLLALLSGAAPPEDDRDREAYERIKAFWDAVKQRRWREVVWGG